MKPNFEEMTNDELKAYALQHRSDEDIEALRLLFSRRKANSQTTVFAPPKTPQEEQEQFELFKRLIEEKEGKKEG
ncbi:hypothetical protein G7B40_003385 [Aetokthonos hydrillicola Thurmond2011]|jgi:hypothetical protein|uniref:Uncharacterized protein n=1 Tax=Aetokthonos hydrillicola Thurmond2011 TaxID=2712845 RepID=A0AAP5I2R7_9CYAN|nr:hypothetical protein [Aetokthonos hydrillicola]MBO3462318.1 hypothetical protein [Aetokthonos hydrillicola CCALA 1050]MBW4590829.1 hypothetical protein [Aetokthonos hydrillicola CCALA 1050]MDR9893626.1 hypothetical protein [Aetokthonos hydrillicola Thurmond2011]